jgi:hypothetical protein
LSYNRGWSLNTRFNVRFLNCPTIEVDHSIQDLMWDF